KLEARRIGLQREHADLRKMVVELVTSMQILAQQKDLQLTCDEGESEIKAWIDVACLNRVMTNLIANAIKFTPAGGWIKVHVSRSDEQVGISVSDNGPGIRPEHKEVIFERFKQIQQQGPRTVSEGIGLGLSICREIVGLHGGKIWVESELGKG